MPPSPHPLFDPEWYRDQNPDLKPEQITFGHYLSEGWRQMRSPHPLFDVEYYLLQRQDVSDVGTEPLTHFTTRGWVDGTNPHKLFEVSFYLRQLPVLGGSDPLTHFVTIGRRLGLSPSKLFDTIWNADSIENSAYRPLLGHLRKAFGPQVPHRQSASASNLSDDGVLARPKGVTRPISVIESRLATFNSTRFESAQDSFQAWDYARANPDVAASLGGDDPHGLLEHWRRHGFREGRTPFGFRPYADRRIDSAFWSRRNAITFYGFFDSKSGLGEAARGYRAAMIEAGFDVVSVNLSMVSGVFETIPDVRAGLNAHSGATSAKVNVFALNADMVHLFFQDNRSYILNGSYNIGIWFWELAHFRPDWASSFGAFDEIWVATEFCKTSIEQISPIPVVKIPVPVVFDRDSELLPRSYFRIQDDVFVIGCVFDVGSVVERKNPEMVIKAFIEAFGHRTDVMLALKYHSAHHYPGRITKLHALAVGYSNIRFYGRLFDEKEIHSFKAILDCLVSAHRSEGFGLNIAEAMLLSKPVIATNYSGSSDFCRDDNSFLLNYKLTELGRQLGPYPKQALWAEPEYDDLVEKLRAVVSDQAVRNARATAGNWTIRHEFDLGAVAGHLRARFDELGLFQEIPRAVAHWNAGVNYTYRFIEQDGPKISVVVPVYNIEPMLLKRCVLSVIEQTYQNWELILHDDGSTNCDTLATLNEFRGIDTRIKISFGMHNEGIAVATNAAVAASAGDFVAFLDNDDELTNDALAEVAAAIERNTDVDLLYSDEDKINFEGEYCDHYFKPDWSPEHLESVMYLLHFLVVRRSVLLELNGLRAQYSGAQDYDLALRVARVARRVVHIPKILYHWRMIPGSASAEVGAKPYGLARAQEALQDHLNASGRNATVEPGLLYGLFRVRDFIAPQTTVTLAIFTDNRTANVAGRGQINLFDHFVNSIFTKTKSRCALRVLAIDNGNLTEAQRTHLERNGGEVVSYDGPRSPFNFSKKANFALKHIKTEIVVLLNDDMEIITPDWVDALVELAQRPTSGVVGARLLYPENLVQHCGIVFGINNEVAHIYHQASAEDIGYNGFTHLIRNYLAVTGACAAFRMSLVDEVGGFDEQLAIDYNDIDFCMRVHNAGYRNIYTPFAQLYHFEGVTQVRTSSNPAERALFVSRWKNYMERDPYYNINLSRTRLDFSADLDN